MHICCIHVPNILLKIQINSVEGRVVRLPNPSYLPSNLDEPSARQKPEYNGGLQNFISSYSSKPWTLFKFHKASVI